MCAAASMAVAPVSVRSSTSWAAYQSAGLTYQSLRSSSDRRYVLDSGGRPNGIPGSWLMITTRPPKPSSRKVAAAVPPALPPPTITIGFAPVLSVMYYILSQPRSAKRCTTGVTDHRLSRPLPNWNISVSQAKVRVTSPALMVASCLRSGTRHCRAGSRDGAACPGHDEWCKNVAPSDELRKWYSHDPDRRFGGPLQSRSSASRLCPKLQRLAYARCGHDRQRGWSWFMRLR